MSPLLARVQKDYCGSYLCTDGTSVKSIPKFLCMQPTMECTHSKEFMATLSKFTHGCKIVPLVETMQNCHLLKLCMLLLLVPSTQSPNHRQRWQCHRRSCY